MPKTKGKILCALLITSMIAVALNVHPSYAATTIYLEPSRELVDPTLQQGELFNITAWINEGTDVASWQVYIAYDPTVLNATSGWVPSTDPEYIFYGLNTFTPPTFFDPRGAILVGDVTLPPVRVNFTTPKKLAIIEFEILGIGRSDLSIDNVDTFLMNPDEEVIPAIKVGSFFNNSPPPPPPATVYIDPEKISDPLLTPSSNFSVNIKIDTATDLYSFQFNLKYDPAILIVNSATLGDFFPPSVMPSITIDNAAGLMSFSASLTPPEAPKNGSGTLAVTTFHVEDIGFSILNLTDTVLSDENGDTLPLNSQDGSFNNVLMAKLYVDPSEVIDPTLQPGSIVNINVTIDDIDSMYGYEFKLGYDSAVLTAIGLRVHRVQNEGNFTIQMSIDDIAGVVWVNVTYRFPAIPITTFDPAALVTIIFQVDGYGTSILDLHDTSIVDQSGLPISHEAQDGFIQTVTRDVAITSVVPSTNWAYPGWPVNITVVAKNKGNLSESFDVKAYYETNLIGIQSVVDLAPGAETLLNFTWDTTGVAPDNYTIWAEATTVPFEADTSDNILVDSSVEIRSIYRDVAVTDVVPPRSWVYTSWTVNINVTVKNFGNVSETFSVKAFYDANLIGTLNVVDLPAGNETSLIFTWDTLGVAPGNYTLKAEADLVPFEYNSANNVYIDGEIQIRLLGDINGDNKVDIKDITAAAVAFGSYVGHPRYNLDADINQDGEVDIRDLTTIAVNFGKVV